MMKKYVLKYKNLNITKVELVCGCHNFKHSSKSKNGCITVIKNTLMLIDRKYTIYQINFHIK